MIFLLKKERMPLLLLILFYLMTRLFNLTLLPIFNDETIYLYWAKLIETTHAHLFISLIDGKPPLLIWVMALFLKVLPQASYLLAGRLPSVITGLISLLGIYALANFLFNSRKMSLLTAFLYIISPFALLYDKMALFDSFLLSAILWAVYFALRTSRSLSKKDALLWGVFLGLAFLAKINAMLYLFLTPLCFLLYANWGQLLKEWKKVLLALLIALGVSQLFRYSLIFSRGYHQYTSGSTTRYALPVSALLKHPFTVFPSNIALYASWFIAYVTWPVFLLGMAGFIMLLKKQPRTGLVLLLVWAVPLIATSFVSIVTIPRYILYILPYFLIASGFAAFQMLRNKLFTLALAVLLLFPIVFDSQLLFNPPSAPLPFADYDQYVSGYPSGYGLQKIFTFLHEASRSKKITLVSLGTISTYPYGFNLEFWSDTNVNITTIWPVEKDSPKVIAELAKKTPVYVVMKFNSYQEHKNFLKELHLRKILWSDKPNSSWPIFLAVPQAQK